MRAPAERPPPPSQKPCCDCGKGNEPGDQSVAVFDPSVKLQWGDVAP